MIDPSTRAFFRAVYTAAIGTGLSGTAACATARKAVKDDLAWFYEPNSSPEPKDEPVDEFDEFPRTRPARLS